MDTKVEYSTRKVHVREKHAEESCSNNTISVEKVIL